LKSVACAFVIKEQGCGQSSAICPSVCSQFGKSLSSISCLQQKGYSSIISKCTSMAVQKADCLDYYDLELDSCGFENATQKSSFCATNSSLKCCGGSGVLNTGVQQNQPQTQPQTQPQIQPQTQPQTQNTGATTTNDQSSTTSTTTSTETTATKTKKKSGGFFGGKTFLILLAIFILVFGLLGYFYYVGSKDEKEENMRNLENGNNRYNNNNYGGQTQTVEVNKNQNVSDNPYEYKPSFDEKLQYGQNTEDPFSDKNRVDAFNTTYNDVQNSVSYQNPALVPAPVETRDIENPFDSPKLSNAENDYNSQINKNMQELSKNFPVDDMPTPSVVKITSIEKPQQGNTNNDDEHKEEENPDDMLKPSRVRMTNIETPIPTNSIPTDKDINIGDKVLKPSMVTLTEIQTPQESSIKHEEENKENNEEENEEPKKAVVNMIDLKSPASNEALNAGNLTPSILVTSTDGKVTSSENLSQEEEVPEEYSEMPEPRPFRAIHAYEPQIDDELRLEVDNEIDVLYEYDDGWCWAINKTTGEQGACPLLCLVSAKEEASGEREWEKDMDVMKVPGRRESMLSNSFDPSRLSFNKK